jgi:hypothetical protein
MSENTVLELFFGKPGMGKTTLAQQRAIARSAERETPILVVDPNATLHMAGALVFRGAPPRDLVDPVWTEGEHCIWTPPKDSAALESFYDKVAAGGNVELLADECSLCGAQGEHACNSLLHLAVTRRHPGVDLFLTSTYPAAVHATIWSSKTTVFLFKIDDAFALDRCRRELQLTNDQVAQVRDLQPFDYIQFPPGD